MISRLSAAIALARADLEHLRALPGLLSEATIEVVTREGSQVMLLTRVLLTGDVIAKVDRDFALRTDPAAAALAREHARRLLAAVAPMAAMPAALARTLGRCATGAATVSGMSGTGISAATGVMAPLGTWTAMGSWTVLAGDLGAGALILLGVRRLARGGFGWGARWWMRRRLAQVGLSGTATGRGAAA